MGRRGGTGIIDTYGKGFATMDRWIANLRSIHGLTKAAAPVVAEMVKRELDTAIAQQRTIEGHAWPTKKGGGRALANAAKALTVRAIGNVIVITLTGVEVFHHFGAGRVPARPILPRGQLPDKLGNAIRVGLVDMGKEWMTRKGGHRKFEGKKYNASPSAKN